MSAAIALTALALLLLPGSAARRRLRSLRPRPQRRARRTGRALVPIAAAPLGFQLIGPAGLLAGALVEVGVRRARTWRAGAEHRADPLLLAAGWDLLAAGMRSGLPPPVVLRAVAAELDGRACRVLREVADHLALGSDPVAGWEPALAHPDTAELARAARRTARTGSALAATAADLAERCRGRAAEHAEARAQRGAVWISAPLGLCFLPAFLCLGVLPIVLGMLHELPVTW
ncbi:type II secretion system F family protein [Saccharopolyspora griseoalba]|uniref:Type II secretion system F family protein n=1 Tax=Saccharopolyspora griseoalba TaxID=1431848 RepID=A0ABW2LJ24_9PSEU